MHRVLNRRGEPHSQTPLLHAPDNAPYSRRGGLGGLPLGVSLLELALRPPLVYKPYLQTPLLYALDNAPCSGRGGLGGLPLGVSLLELALRPLLASTLPSLQQVAAEDALKAIVDVPPLVLAIDWEQIKKFKNKL